jgi:hypothetical protein
MNWLFIAGGVVLGSTVLTLVVLDSDKTPKPAAPQPAPPGSYPLAPPPQFKGFTCTVDCSGHEAGYEWARVNGVTSVDECTGNSASFIEGCTAYAVEHHPGK